MPANQLVYSHLTKLLWLLENSLSITFRLGSGEGYLHILDHFFVLKRIFWAWMLSLLMVLEKRNLEKRRTHLSANAMNDWRNLLFIRSLSSGSLGSTTRAGSLCNNRPLSGMPRAWPIDSNARGSLFLKLICDRRGCELDIEKKANTRMLVCNTYNLEMLPKHISWKTSIPVHKIQQYCKNKSYRN